MTRPASSPNSGASRLMSILPDEDADEAYCERHDSDMRAFDPVIHIDGAIYATTEPFRVYVCGRCLSGATAMINRHPDVPPGEHVSSDLIMKVKLRELFDMWDAGDVPGDWFEYLSEGTVDDDTVYFEEDGS